jgi:hypothetical protein
VPGVGAGFIRGGLRMGRNVAVEGEGAIGLDTEEEGGTTVELDSHYAIYLVGLAPATDNLDVFARVGLGRAGFDTNTNGIEDSDEVGTINYGLGVQGFFWRNLGVRADYTRIDNREDRDGPQPTGEPNIDADVFTLALVWRMR